MQRTSMLATVSCALLLGACVTTGQQTSSSAGATQEAVKLVTCEKPIASLDVRLVPDFANRLDELEKMPPSHYVEDIYRRSGCFRLVHGKADYTVTVAVDANRELPYVGLAGVATAVGAVLFPPSMVLFGGAMAAGEASIGIAQIDATVTQEVVLSNGSYERLVTKLEPTHINSGYVLPAGTADWETSPEGKALGLAQILAVNELIGHLRGQRVS